MAWKDSDAPFGNANPAGLTVDGFNCAEPQNMNSWKAPVFTIAVFLCGCASTVPTGTMSTLAPPAPGKATVYVFQASMGIVSENVPLFVGDEKIGALALHSYTWFQCDPGFYRIAVGDSLVSHRMVAATRMPLVAGEVVYLKYVLNPQPDSLRLVGGFFADAVSGKQISEPDPLYRISEEEAGKLMKRYALVGNTVGQDGNPPVAAIARFDSEDVVPQVLKMATPEYPESLRKAGIKGRVIVEFVLNTEGRAVDAVAVESPDPKLSRLAIEALSKSEFTPGIKNGVPVSVRMRQSFTFGEDQEG